MSISAGERYFIVRLAPFCSTSDMVELSCVAISVQNVYGMGPISDGAKPEGLFGREQSQASQLYRSKILDPDHLGPPRLDKITLR